MAIDPLPERALQDALSGLSVACTEHSDLVVVALEGELDIYTTARFREGVRHYDPAEVQMVIDLGKVGLLDSAGLGALASLRNQARRGGIPLGIVCPDRRMVRLFWATGLRSAFILADDLASLRAALPSSREHPASGS
jgi:anti-sigma B factor antagonist